MHKSIVNVADVELVPRPAEFQPKGASAPLYDLKMALISAGMGAKLLGYNVTAVAAGKCAFPFHSHRVNEEMFFVVSGNGEIRPQDEAQKKLFRFVSRDAHAVDYWDGE